MKHRIALIILLLAVNLLPAIPVMAQPYERLEAIRFIQEGDNFLRSAGTPEAVRRMAQYMAMGGQTAEVELEMGEQVSSLAKSD